MEIKILLDEDKFVEKFQKLPKDERKRYIRQALVVCGTASEFQKKGLISKTINHRIHNILDFFNENRIDLMPKEKFNELFDIKPINLKFFRNAMLRFWNLLKDENNMKIFKDKLKVFQDMEKYD